MQLRKTSPCFVPSDRVIRKDAEELWLLFCLRDPHFGAQNNCCNAVDFTAPNFTFLRKSGLTFARKHGVVPVRMEQCAVIEDF